MASSNRLEALLGMLERGQDSALLRFSLANEYRAAGRHEEAIEHLGQAVKLDPGYSAAWKLLGRSLESAGRPDDALAAWRTGIEAAETKGDRQAAKEMTVFLRRLEKKRNDAP
ncbi:MAG TPA: tetratricopeptide repeat protein [Woeseiaceae bacterium]|nr:tetratricopeptide repeat protein [Woeseiaceae bacterium]